MALLVELISEPSGSNSDPLRVREVPCYLIEAWLFEGEDTAAESTVAWAPEMVA